MRCIYVLWFWTKAPEFEMWPFILVIWFCLCMWENGNYWACQILSTQRLPCPLAMGNLANTDRTNYVLGPTWPHIWSVNCIGHISYEALNIKQWQYLLHSWTYKYLIILPFPNCIPKWLVQGIIYQKTYSLACISIYSRSEYSVKKQWGQW